MAQLNFDASQVAPSTGTADAIPVGWYNAAIDESEMKPTKLGDGQFLQLRFNILDGMYAGRKVFTRLNLQNLNPVAVEIAYKDLSAICHATGTIQIQDSSMLHGKPLKIKVKMRAATAEYEASNEISAYKNINDPSAVNTGGAAAAPMAAPQYQPAAPQQFQPPPQQFAPPQQPAYAAPQPAYAAPQQQQPWQQPPQQQPAVQQQQPWQQAPQAPQAAPVVQQVQPWQQAPQAAPVQQAPQQMAPMQQQPQQPWQAPPGVAPAAGPQQATPPWAQQPVA